MFMEENRAVKVITNIGIRKGIEQTAVNLLQRGHDIQEVLEVTGLSPARLAELQEKQLA